MGRDDRGPHRVQSTARFPQEVRDPSQLVRRFCRPCPGRSHGESSKSAPNVTAPPMYRYDISHDVPEPPDPSARSLTMLEMAILGLLSEQAMHGYEIRKRLRDELGILSNVSFGSLYPALGRLERSGAVEAAEDPRFGAPPTPMTGSLSGERAAFRARRSATALGRRGRKVYRITDEGRRQFAELLDDERAAGTDDARGFGLRLAFARYLPPQARLRLLERRRAQLVQRLADARAAATSVEGRLDTYTRSLM